jgi:hypothetical protein
MWAPVYDIVTTSIFNVGIVLVFSVGGALCFHFDGSPKKKKAMVVVTVGMMCVSCSGIAIVHIADWSEVYRSFFVMFWHVTSAFGFGIFVSQVASRPLPPRDSNATVVWFVEDRRPKLVRRNFMRRPSEKRRPRWVLC